MDSKKLVKVIKALVEAEVSKRQEVFLKKTFPKILDEAVKARMKTITSKKTNEVDPFSLANAVLDVPLISLSLLVSCLRLVGCSGCAAVIKLVTVPLQAKIIFTNLPLC